MTITKHVYAYFEDSTTKIGKTGLADVAFYVKSIKHSDSAQAVVVNGTIGFEVWHGIYGVQVAGMDLETYDYIGVAQTASTATTSKEAPLLRWDAAEEHVDDFVAIEAKTGNLPSDPADQSAIEAAITAATSPLATLAKLLKYVQLLARKDAAIATDNATELTAINADGGSGAGTFDNTTDSEQAIRDTEPMGTAMRGTDGAYTGTPPTVLQIQSGLATSANQTTILNRIGAFAGTGLNTILGFLRALARKDAALTPSAMGGTYDNTVDSQEAQTDAIETLRVSNAAVTGATVADGVITIRNYAQASIPLTGLPDFTGYTQIVLVGMRHQEDLDPDSLFYLLVSATPDAGDGLQYLNGAAATKSDGSLTVVSTTAVTGTIKASAMAELTAMAGVYCGVKAKIGGDWISLGEYTLNIENVTPKVVA